ncbi:unnamed protein product [Penicillium egyptiacum]|uniref:Uncharacterized protein n=1 Tax=Penicillium egyptiacum TaxID=1303716 RepID=A0A9W4KLR2_9EURO|nr:unnamed protein product [Penicillium egyptiacum]
MSLQGLGLISPFLQQPSYQSKFEISNISPMACATLKYGERQAGGRLLQQWMERPESDPSVPECPSHPSKLRLEDLKKSKALTIDTDMFPYVPVQIEEEFAGLGIMGPSGGAWTMVSIDGPVPTDSELQNLHAWEGQVAPRLLVVEEMQRIPEYFMSEVCQAVYQDRFEIGTLRYVYMIDVCNRDTLSFVKEELYTEPNGLVWPDDQIRDWQAGTPEFEALLGTQVGRTVAHLVLGAMGCGTRRISRIRSYHSFEGLQLQFAIEEIEQIVPTVAPSARVTRSMTRRQQVDESRKRKAEDEETEAKKIRKTAS